MKDKCWCGGKMERADLSKMFNTVGEFGSKMISVTNIPGKRCVKCHTEIMSVGIEIRVENFVKMTQAVSGSSVEFPG